MELKGVKERFALSREELMLKLRERLSNGIVKTGHRRRRGRLKRNRQNRDELRTESEDVLCLACLPGSHHS